jgi:hypothetical protein
MKRFLRCEAVQKMENQKHTVFRLARRLLKLFEKNGTRHKSAIVGRASNEPLSIGTRADLGSTKHSFLCDENRPEKLITKNNDFPTFARVLFRFFEKNGARRVRRKSLKLRNVFIVLPFLSR